jgi:hypothetical protein
VRYVISPFMWRQAGKCLVWLWTDGVLRHIRDCLVSARSSLMWVLTPSMFFGAPKPLCTSCHSVARRRASISTINCEFLALVDCGIPTVTGQGVGVLEKAFEHVISVLEARSDKDEDFVMLCPLMLAASKHESYKLNATSVGGPHIA